jgi:hypothetical protein
MKCLSPSESSAYLREHGLHFAGAEYAGFLQGSLVRRGAEPRVLSAGTQMTMPDSSTKQSSMLLTLFAAASHSTGWLISLIEWGVWGEGYYDIWAAIRALHGEARSLREAPSHLFGTGEEPLARGLARLVLSFGWDAYLIALPAKLVVYVSHEDYMEVYTPTQRKLDTLAVNLEVLGFKKWK